MKKKELERQWMRAVIALACLLPAGCSSDMLPDGADREAVNADPVHVSIMEASLDAETITAPTSRASSTTSLAQNGKVVKLFLTDANTSGTKYTNRYQEDYTYSSSAGAWQAVKPFYVDARKANIYACYDPNRVVTFATNSTMTATADNLKAQPNDDAKLWYYDFTNKGVNNANAQLNFTLKCAYSRLTLSLSKTSDYPNSCKVSQVLFKPSTGTFRTAATVDIASGTLSGTTASNYVINTTSYTMYTSGLTTVADTSIDLLFPAQKLAANAGLTFTLTVDGINYSVTVPAAKFNEFKRGVRHTANLVMSGAGIMVSSVSTTDWPSVSNTNVDSKFD